MVSITHLSRHLMRDLLFDLNWYSVAGFPWPLIAVFHSHLHWLLGAGLCWNFPTAPS